MLTIKMRGMRNLNEGSRITGSSLPEILRAFDISRTRIGSRAKAAAKIDGKTKPGEYLTALVIRFLDMSEAEQVATISYGMKRLEEIKGREDDGGDWLRPEERKPPSGGKGGTGGGSNPAVILVDERPKPRGEKRAGK